jgi:hypothetical protein
LVARLEGGVGTAGIKSEEEEEELSGCNVFPSSFHPPLSISSRRPSCLCRTGCSKVVDTKLETPLFPILVKNVRIFMFLLSTFLITCINNFGSPCSSYAVETPFYTCVGSKICWVTKKRSLSHSRNHDCKFDEFRNNNNARPHRPATRLKK